MPGIEPSTFALRVRQAYHNIIVPENLDIVTNAEFQTRDMHKYFTADEKSFSRTFTMKRRY